jgi:hypothetical protein
MSDSQPQTELNYKKLNDDQKPVLWKILVLCVVSALGNIFICNFFTDFVRVPLYLDTVLTIAVCFSIGLLPGLLTGALLYPLLSPFILKYIMGIQYEVVLISNLFIICTIAEILLVCFFLKKIKTRHEAFLRKPTIHSFMGIAPLLLTLAALACIVVSITGGIIDFALTMSNAPRAFFPEDTFKLGLLRNNMPLLASAILSRIPINIVDRFFVMFGGFGISLVYRRFLKG